MTRWMFPDIQELSYKDVSELFTYQSKGTKPDKFLHSQVYLEFKYLAPGT